MAAAVMRLMVVMLSPLAAWAGGLPLDGAEKVRMDNLWTWAAENGARGLEGVRPAMFQKGKNLVRGLEVATDAIESTATMKYVKQLVFPKELMLSAEHDLVKKSATYAVGPSESWGMSHRLILYLATEGRKVLNGGYSFWKPFIDAIPTREDYALYMPYYASKELLEDFSRLPMVQVIQDDDALVPFWTRHGDAWIKLAKEAGVQGLTFEDFKWAYVVVFTRNYGAGDHNVLVPVTDLANTGKKSNCNWEANPQLTNFTVRFTADMPLGTELLEPYVDGHDNGQMLLNYGFSLDSNPFPPQRLSKEDCKALEGSLASDPDYSPQSSTLAAFQALAREHCRPEDPKSEEL